MLGLGLALAGCAGEEFSGPCDHDIPGTYVLSFAETRNTCPSSFGPGGSVTLVVSGEESNLNVDYFYTDSAEVCTTGVRGCSLTANCDFTMTGDTVRTILEASYVIAANGLSGTERWIATDSQTQASCSTDYSVDGSRN